MSGDSGSVPSLNRPNENEICEDLVIVANLASPQVAVIDGLNEGDILTIVAASDQGPVQALNEQNQVAGTIFTREQVRLLNCINAGNVYIAEVLSIDNGQCQVQIRAT